MLLKIEKNSDWMYSSPFSSEVSSPSFSAKRKAVISRYQSIQLDGLIHWQNIIARSQAGAVATGMFMDIPNAVFKTIDISKRDDGLAQFNKEVSVYRKLEDLQGVCIPHLIAYGNLGGLLQVIILEFVGRSITKGEAIGKKLEIDNTVKQIHAKGIVHNDLRLPNILLDSQGMIRIIDFGMSAESEGEITETFEVDSDAEME
jgi:serine/threonine protein kinase